MDFDNIDREMAWQLKQQELSKTHKPETSGLCTVAKADL
jgi:hypothetical protein